MASSGRFLADGMLGKLCRWMRFFGYDTEYAGSKLTDDEIVLICRNSNLILVTMDIELSRRLENSVLLRTFNTDEQLGIVTSRFHIDGELAMSRCPDCNGILTETDTVNSDSVPRGISDRFRVFMVCSHCHKVYWKGTHYNSIIAKIAQIKEMKNENYI